MGFSENVFIDRQKSFFLILVNNQQKWNLTMVGRGGESEKLNHRLDGESN